MRVPSRYQKIQVRCQDTDTSFRPLMRRVGTSVESVKNMGPSHTVLNRRRQSVDNQVEKPSRRKT